ncbi:MAG: nitroreductase family protein [Proteobacteria bacterium]|uniref:Nitroreductase family protein n=1 Tax=Candidatus Avisuccinivibrio stercorigallinarum TaxID=2840704 RepID=A0A9D9GNI7_9GAMM|nr:nitroreductase family protein [Candidatus Avisuccinivibrio stercorigallinarum]
MDCLEVLFNHQSLRSFEKRALTETEVNNIKRAVVQTSSACFYQVVRTVRVTDRKLLQQIGEVSGGTMKLAKAPEFWLFCLDYSLLRRVGELPDKIPFHLFFLGVNDCALACQNALTAAEAQGLGGVVIGGFNNAINAVCEILKLPKGVAPCIGLVLGKPDERWRGEQKPRLPVEWLIQENGFTDPYNEEEFSSYNERFRQYCLKRTSNQKDKTWAQACASSLARKDHRDDLIAFYQQQGFEFV